MDPCFSFHTISRIAKFKHPLVFGNQKISEDNQKLKPGCPPDYQIFCERIDPKMFIPTNLFSYLSLINKNSSMITSTTYIEYGNKMTKIMTRTTRCLILVVLRLPTFGSNFATLISLSSALHAGRYEDVFTHQTRCTTSIYLS